MAAVPDEVLAGTDWNKTFQRLVLYAYKKLGHGKTLAEAEDLASEAIRQFLDPHYAGWDPNRQTLWFKLGSIVNGLIQNRKRVKASKEVAHDFESSQLMSPAATPDDRAINGSEAKRAFALLEQELRGDEHGENVLLLECDGMSDPKMQAEALGLPIATVYKARYRLGQAREAVRRRMECEDPS